MTKYHSTLKINHCHIKKIDFICSHNDRQNFIKTMKSNKTDTLKKKVATEETKLLSITKIIGNAFLWVIAIAIMIAITALI